MKPKKNYRHSFSGMLSRMYYYMQRRVKGETNKAHIYKGLPLASRKKFYKFASKNQNLKKLYTHWSLSNYKLASRPTPHRKNSNRGYQVDNVQFVTYSKNSKMIKRRKK